MIHGRWVEGRGRRWRKRHAWTRRKTRSRTRRRRREGGR